MVIFGLAIITLIYILFPILYKAHKGKTTFPKALLLSLINSLVCTIILLFIAKYGAGTNMVDYISRYLPVYIFFFILFTLIGIAILKKKKIKNENKDTAESNNDLQSDTINEEQNNMSDNK